MRKIFLILIFNVVLLPSFVLAQEDEIEQLILNYQKLRQLEDILENMYKGYQILTKGYNTIKDIAEGNFNLHQVFLDGLLEVNPKIKEYYKIPKIIQYQQLLVKEYKQAWNYLKGDQYLTREEINYIEKVYSGLFKESLKDLDELLMATTASKLRMSDDERLQTIDRVFLNMEDKLAFLRYFNNSTRLLTIQRAKEAFSNTSMQKLHEVK